MDVLCQAKQSSDSSKPTEDIKLKTNNEGKAQASKLKYKKIHKVWDKNKSKYKIVDSVREDKAIDDLDQYIFVVWNQLDRMTKETKTFVDIKSEVLLDVLQEIVRDVRAISLCKDKPSVLFHFSTPFC
ncbi:conserved hypothetical protein [Histoplasma capsulatum var. duboisii H88]|uniref:Uncharacterized protein n=1 Tax=Ajellomyces capsulatus (strain H88) TaxID=544711 RepID=F0UFY0_AJEC8|nr:conserved hypothetical protein [Histoplasma capsulatum var. duboisii H88]